MQKVRRLEGWSAHRERSWRTHSERGGEEYSLRATPDSPDEPERNADAPNGLPGTREGPAQHGNDRVDETSATRREYRPGGAENEQGESGLVEVDRARDSDGDVSHGTQALPRGDDDEREVKTAAPGRDTGQGGRVRVQDGSDDIERNLECDNDGDGDGYDERWARMDGTASGGRRESKRLDTKTLAGGGTDQHGRYGRTTDHIPRSPTRPSKHIRHPTGNPNPP